MEQDRFVAKRLSTPAKWKTRRVEATDNSRCSLGLSSPGTTEELEGYWKYMKVLCFPF